MRRLIPSVIAGLLIGLALAPATPSAASAPTPSASPTPGKKVCTIKDPRLVELSGLVATKSGYVVVNDSSEGESRERIFFLDKKCNVVREVPYSGGGPRDPEDLALAPDGKTLFIADIGDNPTSKERRPTIALWTMPVDGSKPVIHRLTYPDGPHDAEALLFKPDGTPIIVTKESGKSALYAPTGPLQPETREGVPMEKLGEVKIPETRTHHPLLGAVARKLVTGGATSPDGSRVVLRTYTDAFEWDVTDGDVVTALTTGTPRVTPLPDEPLGEAISYTSDGKLFVTVSETEGLEDTQPVILSYTPGADPVTPVADGADGERKSGPSLLDRLGLQGIMYLVAAVGVLGAIMVAVGVYGILRSRKRAVSHGDDGPTTGRSPVSASGRARTYDGNDRGGPLGDYREPDADYDRGGSSGGVYVAGGSRDGYGRSHGGSSGSVYGGSSGTVYGGGQGSVYGRAAGGAVYGGSSGTVYGSSAGGSARGAGTYGAGARAGDGDERYGYRY